MRFLVYIIFLILIISCTTQTKITGIWNDENYKTEDFKKISVLAITPNAEYRDIFEDIIAKKLIEIGYTAVSGSVIINQEMVKLKDKKSLEKALLKESIDAAIVISLLDIKEDTYYVENYSEPYRPYSYGLHYGSFYDYYYYNYDRVYSPGYYQTTKEIFLESNFYSLISDKLVQTIQSETIDPTDVSDLAESYSSTLVQQLLSESILKNKSIVK